MRAFEANADTLPLRQVPSGLLWPKGQPLPPKWREGFYMERAELRSWAKEYAPELLGSALLAEPQAASAEQPSAPVDADPSTQGRSVVVEEVVRSKPVGRQRSMQEDILRAICELGHAPKKLPKNAPGKPGVKAAVRKKLGYTSKTESAFLHAWDALRHDREIVDSD